MKNITIALDDETHHKACVATAQRNTAISAPVKKYLIPLTAETGMFPVTIPCPVF